MIKLFKRGKRLYMFFEYTTEEKEELDRIEAEYEQKVRELDAKILELRPDDPEPPQEPINALRSKIKAIYDKLPDDKQSAEYKRLQGQITRYSKQIASITDEWEDAGSDEWKAARSERNRIDREIVEKRSRHYWKAEERYVASLGNDYEKIYQDAIKQIIPLIESIYGDYEKRLSTEALELSAYDVRLKADGSFVLDREETRKNVLKVLDCYLRALDEDHVRRFGLYLDTLLEYSPYVSDGALWGYVKSDSLKIGRNKVKKSVRATTRVQGQIFKNKFTFPDEETGILPEASYLDRWRTLSAAVSVDFNALVESGIFEKIPKLTGFDEDVYNAICSNWYAGNKRITYDMIYRAMTGKINGRICVTEDFYAAVDAALNKFRAVTKLSFAGEDKDGNTREFSADEPLVQFKRGRYSLNGIVTDRLIELTSEPVLLSWGWFNHGEVSTRDITLLDVPKLNNGEESATIRRILLGRVDKMRHLFDKTGGKKEVPANYRRIRYDFIYDELGISDPNKTKRNLVKEKVDRILEYWTSKGFISGYEHVRDSKSSYYAVDIFFLRK